ncbi:hypothetical protein QAD02_020559 [Eretmocerus hayati]|uniref:Uncharacterized protein n=1 Tax=Eretmocerus hayati TaxID=131215 RepID=A0ACC2PP14_9HYME|nr:hypothetical protein QAD02_020559 [Eretmocerus hayati]
MHQELMQLEGVEGCGSMQKREVDENRRFGTQSSIMRNNDLLIRQFNFQVSHSYDEVLVDDCKSNTQEYLPSTPPTCGLKPVAGEELMLDKDSNTVMVKQENYKAACHGSSSYTGVSKVPGKKLMLARGRNSVKVQQEVREAASRPNRSYTGVSKKVGGRRMMEHQPLLSYDKIKSIFPEVLAEGSTRKCGEESSITNTLLPSKTRKQAAKRALSRNPNSIGKTYGAENPVPSSNASTSNDWVESRQIFLASKRMNSVAGEVELDDSP